MLLDAVLDAMWKTPGMRRMEAQLMMLGAPLEPSHAVCALVSQFYPRRFLEAPLLLSPPLPRGHPGVNILTVERTTGKGRRALDRDCLPGPYR